MKRIFYAAAVLAVISGTSCTKEEENVAVVPQEEQEDMVTLKVSVPVVESKATATDDEKAVSTLQVFVFRTDGTLDGYSSSSSSTVSVSCTTGEKDIVALVNAPSITTITTKSALQATISDLSDNTTGAFVMYGENPGQEVSTNTSVTVEVARLVARVGIAEIANGFTLSQYKDDVTLEAIYLVNVAGDVVYANTSEEAYTPTVWYNQKKNNSEQTGLLASEGLDTEIDAGESYTTAHYFYCYPNPTKTDSSESDWSARFTRLVVQVSIGGTTYYYPINIDNIQSNYTYEISKLTLTKLGSTSPDVPIDTDQASFTLSFAEWSEVSMGTVEI